MSQKDKFDASMPGQGYDPETDDTTAPEISKETIAAYETLFLRILRQGQERRWNGEIEFRYPLTYREMADDLLQNPRALKYATLVKIRSAMLYCMEGQAGEDVKEYMRTAEYMSALKIAGGVGPIQSRPKGRHIPEDDYHKILDHLRKGRGLSIATLIFLRATVACGARPIEWASAEWADRRNGKLKFLTAKSKSRNALNGSSFNEGRIFKEGEEAKSYRLVSVDPEDIDLVDEHILRVRKELSNAGTGFLFDEMPHEMKQQYLAAYYLKCKTTLSRASKKATDKLYSLYDARSTFAANRRARDGLISAASELGHTTDKPDTKTSSHYANTYKAWSAYKHTNKQVSVHSPISSEGANSIPVTFNLPEFKSVG